MDDRQFDALLSDGAPAVAEPTLQLRDALTAVSDEVRGRRARRRTWAWAAGLTSLLMVAGAGAAVASPGVRQWLGWEPDRTISYTSTTGDACTAAFKLEYQQKQNGLVHTKDEVYAVAMAAADRLDLSPENVTAMVTAERAELETTDPSSPWLSLSASDFEDWVVSESLHKALDLAFAEAGIVRVDTNIAVTCDRTAR